MTWFRDLRRAFSSPPPTPAPVSRRRFFAGAGALAGGLLLADDARAGTPAAPLDIEPGAMVDAQGRPLDRALRPDLPFLGEIFMAGFNFAPLGYLSCSGQLLPISTYSALFSLLGTTYGGDGRTTFGLPDLRGRVPISSGQGAGLSDRTLGASGGQEAHTLTAAELPAHSHPLPEAQVRGTGTQVVGATTGGDRGTSATGAAGGGQPHNNMPPFLAVNFYIATEGVFPSRS